MFDFLRFMFSFSKESSAHFPIFDDRSLETLRRYLCDYNPPEGCVNRINILLYGMVGAGKSAAINTFLSALDQHGTTTNCVPTGDDLKSLTPQLKAYRLNALQFWDPSGWNALDDADRGKKVLTMILEGRVPPGTDLQHFKPDSDNQYLVIPENVIHGVAFIFNTDTMDNISKELMEQFKDLQTIVAQKYIQRIMIGTKLDQLEIPKKYYHIIYNYKPLQNKFAKFSSSTGMDKNQMFIISNELKGVNIERTKCILALYALENMVRNIDKYFKVAQ
ncbi:interferon-induced protein 44-like [Heptranchias perlo]|uniref:interferon-induced protein 44-like n=1 Tax=Heptranchias perlo TaxID=212740 RepID=UPI003559AADD